MIRGQLLWRGVTFGIDTDIGIIKIQGLEDLPDADYSGVARPRAHGAWAGDILAQARIVEVTFEIVSDDTAPARKVLRDSTYYTPGDETELLQFLIDDQVVFLNAQLLRRSLPLDSTYDRLNTAVLQWTCPDPRKYGAPQLVEIPFPAAGAGLPYPFAYPSAYAMGETGSRTITNAGTESTPVVITVPGMVNLPWVEFILPDGSIRRVNINLTIASGEPLVLDSLEATATVGGANRYQALSGALLSELMLPPGQTTVRWGAFSGTPNGPLTVAFADAEM